MVILFFTASVLVMQLLALCHVNPILYVLTETELSLAEHRPVYFAVYSTQHCLEPHRYLYKFIRLVFAPKVVSIF